MKHGTRFWQKKLGRTPQHRQDLLKNMITSMVLHQKIETTVAKATFIQRSVNLMIENAKKGQMDLVQESLFQHETTLPIVKDTLLPRYSKRTGGYTRLLRLGRNPSGTDRAEKVILEFVDHPKDTIYHLAKLHLPTHQKKFNEFRADNYIERTNTVKNASTGKTETITEWIPRPGIRDRAKLERKRIAMVNTITKYEKALKSYPIARALEQPNQQEASVIESPPVVTLEDTAKVPTTDTENPEEPPKEDLSKEEPKRKKGIFNDIFKKLGFL